MEIKWLVLLWTRINSRSRTWPGSLRPRNSGRLPGIVTRKPNSRTDILDKVWQLGFCPNVIPEKYGGYELGRSALNSAIMVEELAWGDVSLTLGALSPLLMMLPILEFGSEEQKEEWLPKFCGEQFFPATAALMEPRITFDPMDLRTVAQIRGDEIVINGVKCMVPMAEEAEHILVYAASAEGGGPSSVKAIIVDKDTPGLKISEREKNLGLNSLPLFRVTFEDCVVPKSRQVGGDQGIDYMRLLNLSRSTLCAMAVGVARASYEYARGLCQREVCIRGTHCRQTIHCLHVSRIRYGGGRNAYAGMEGRVASGPERRCHT